MSRPGYDMYDPDRVRRASRDSTSEDKGKSFDLRIFKDDYVLMAIEVKALDSEEIKKQKNY